MQPAYVVPDGVAWVVDEDGGPTGPAVYLTRVRAGLPIALEGPAAQIWDAARSMPEDEITAEVALATGQTTDTVRDSVESFLRELLRRGLLQVREPDEGAVDR
ncbi:PqqD family peptide modification chaperone [Allobranchiibius sp. GilTou38]|uniref:PqqD family peptide modification chaperone n=1 Tax=Allobranchiibius sp. GilTou38 TaxID=2815210 RepID=UPI001AA1A53D|nr:PqqD family peptide modification chaperone [Allobranchiibius sp. GilTou38]MBO1765219.1 PqqD family peptide modification chaperone [Allobranchiibius sp. GilTou38]